MLGFKERQIFHCLHNNSLSTRLLQTSHAQIAITCGMGKSKVKDKTPESNSPSSSTARRSSSSSQSTVKRFSTKKPLDFFDHRTANGFRAVPGFRRSITCKYFYRLSVIFFLKDVSNHKALRHEDLKGHDGITPLIFSLDTRYR